MTDIGDDDQANEREIVLAIRRVFHKHSVSSVIAENMFLHSSGAAKIADAYQRYVNGLLNPGAVK